MSDPKVSVVISAFKQMECGGKEAKKFPFFEYSKPIKGCVKSVKAQKYPDFEIIFANKKSEVGASDIRNEAIERCNGTIIMTLDGDVILHDPLTIRKIVDEFENVEADIIIGTPITPREQTNEFVWLIGLEYTERLRSMGKNYVDAGATTFMAYRRDVFDKVPFPDSEVIKTDDPFFNSAFLDWDFCGVVRENGFKIWNPVDIYYTHLYQAPPLNFIKKQLYHGIYRWFFIKRFNQVAETYLPLRVMTQPMLTALSFLCLLLGLLTSLPLTYGLILLALSIISPLPTIRKFYIQEQNPMVLFLFPIYFILTLMWLTGFGLGIIGVIPRL